MCIIHLQMYVEYTGMSFLGDLNPYQSVILAENHRSPEISGVMPTPKTFRLEFNAGCVAWGAAVRDDVMN